MKKLSTLLILFILFLQACTPIQWDEFVSDAADQALDQTLVDTVPTILPPNNILYDESGNMIPDFIPALQPFVNEGCNTAWDNLSGIVNPDGSVTYFTWLPDYTADSTDYDKSRFTFIYQAKNPWFGIFEDEAPYAQMASPSWYTLPIDDYGNMTCQGLQEIRIWVLDELTSTWYMNSQVCWAAVLCNGQGDCDQGYNFDQIEYTPYESGYIYIQPNPITNY
jgi:hypothetical protein